VSEGPPNQSAQLALIAKLKELGSVHVDCVQVRNSNAFWFFVGFLSFFAIPAGFNAEFGPGGKVATLGGLIGVVTAISFCKSNHKRKHNFEQLLASVQADYPDWIDTVGGTEVLRDPARLAGVLAGLRTGQSAHALQPVQSLPLRGKGSNRVTLPVADSNTLKYNPMALTGFVMGLVSLPLSFIGIIAIAGLIFSVIGLVTFDRNSQKSAWMPAAGLALNLMGILATLSAYGHLR
jgi:hypothetical protein